MSYNELIIKKMRAINAQPNGRFGGRCAALFWLLCSGCRDVRAGAEEPESGVSDGDAQQSEPRRPRGRGDDLHQRGFRQLRPRPRSATSAADLRAARPQPPLRRFRRREDPSQAGAQAQGVVLTDDEEARHTSKSSQSAMGDRGQRRRLPAVGRSPLSDRLLVEKYLSLLVKDIKVDDKEVAAYYEPAQERLSAAGKSPGQPDPARFRRQGERGPGAAERRDAKMNSGPSPGRESAGPEAVQGRDHGRLQRRPASPGARKVHLSP